MDSHLQDILASELDPNEQVEVLVRLAHPNRVPEKIRTVSQFGPIITCRIRKKDILEVYRSREIISMKAPRFVAFDQDWEWSEPSTRKWQLPETLSETDTGKNTVVAVLDWGIDFAHPNFLNSNGLTRLLAVWDQSDNTGKGLAPYGYGRLITQEEINAALKSRTPYRQLGYHPGKSDSRKTGTHGTHVMDIAAGNGSLGNKGVAPEADLIFIHLASRGTPTGTLGDSSRILEAIDCAKNLAGDRNLVINISVGRHGGPHDGLTLVEQGIDYFLQSHPNTMICQSTGNYYQSRTHHSDIVRPGKIQKFSFYIQKADRTLNEMEIWYPGSDLFGIELIHNATGANFSCPINSKKDVVIDSKRIGRIYHRDKEPNNGKSHINLFLYKNSPSGRWTVKLKGKRVSDGRYHAWIERDGSCKACQSRFDPPYANSNSTTGTIANGFNSIVCGAYETLRPNFKIAYFSSKGPTLDGRYKPDIVAPGFDILGARSTPIRSQVPRPSTVRMRGTSMASPRVAGAVALVLDQLPENTPYWQIRNIIIGSASPIIGADAARVGAGALNIPKAVQAAKRYTQLVTRKQRVLQHAGYNTYRIPPRFDSTGHFDAFDDHISPNENLGFIPSYKSKTFLVSDGLAILRDRNMVPKTIRSATQEVERNSRGTAVLIKGKRYPILNVIKSNTGDLIAQVGSTFNPQVPLGWTMASNFEGKLYNESIRLRPAPVPFNSSLEAFTISNKRAIIRNPNSNFGITGKTIPLGTIVRLLSLSSNRRYAKVQLVGANNRDISGRIHWTAFSNLTKGWVNLKGPHSAWRRGQFIGMVNLIDVIGTRQGIKKITDTTWQAFSNLVNQALKDGVFITLNSGFRSFPEQEYLFSQWKKGVKGFNMAAKPGHSNHQNGIAFDFNTTGSKGSGFGTVYNWLKSNGPRFGFIRTVSKEHWHWEYLPQKAKKLNAIGEYRNWMSGPSETILPWTIDRWKKWHGPTTKPLTKYKPRKIVVPGSISCGFFKATGLVTKKQLVDEIVKMAWHEHRRWTSTPNRYEEDDSAKYRDLVHYWLSVTFKGKNATPSKLTNLQTLIPLETGLTKSSNFKTTSSKLNRLVGGGVSSKIKSALRQAKLSTENTTPWSAAFVVSVIRSAIINLGLEYEINNQIVGQGSILFLGGSHSKYGKPAYKRRKNEITGCYQAFGRRERPIEVGDIIITDRRFQKASSTASCARRSFGMSDVRTKHTDLSRQPACTHGDIVVSIDRSKNSVIAIGGNINDSVRRRRYPIDSNGYLDIDNTAQRLYTTETNTGTLPDTSTTTSRTLQRNSTSRIFAVLKLVEACATPPGTTFGTGVLA